jgi:hypothetical protein
VHSSNAGGVEGRTAALRLRILMRVSYMKPLQQMGRRRQGQGLGKEAICEHRLGIGALGWRDGQHLDDDFQGILDGGLLICCLMLQGKSTRV